MNANKLLNDLMKITLDTSMFEERRDYVSLSGIINDVEALLNDYRNGYTTDDAGKLKCRMGYYMEAGLKERLMQIPGIEEHPPVIVPGTNGLIKGHPDFSYYGYPADCKSFLADEHMPDGKERRISAKIFWQMQGYMCFTGKDKSFVVCESRQSGFIRVIEIRANATIQERIKGKVESIKKILIGKPGPLVTT